MWETFNREYVKESMKSKETPEGEPKLPTWLEKYMEYKFNLLDRTGIGVFHIVCFTYLSHNPRKRTFGICVQ